MWALNDDRSELLCLDVYLPSQKKHEFGAELVLQRYPQYAAAIGADRAIAIAIAIAAKDVRTHAAPLGFGRQWFSDGPSALLGAPLRAQDRVVAVVCFEVRGTTRRWPPEEVTFAASMADLVSLLFETAARHRAEAELDRQRAYLREIVDVDPNVIYAKDSSGVFSLVNSAAADVFGRPAEALVGRTEEAFGQREHTSAAIDQAVLESGNEIFMAEESIVDAAGRRRWFQTVKRPPLDADGRPKGTDLAEAQHDVITAARRS